MENTVDFPSVLGITVHFLKKIECKDNPFAGTNVVKVKDFPSAEVSKKNGMDQKKKLF